MENRNEAEQRFQRVLDLANSADPDGRWAYHLANDYRFGSGTEKNPELAITWYKKAADKGYIDAYPQIGLMYSCGEVSGLQDESKALKYYLLAIENSIDGEIDPHSYQAAALAYCYGEGVPQNLGKAVIMGRKAVNGYQTYKNGAFKDVPEVNVAKLILAKALLQVGETHEAVALLGEVRNCGESEIVNMASELLDGINEGQKVEDEYILSGSTLTIRAFNTSIYVNVPSIIEKNSNTIIDTLVFEDGIESIVGAGDTLGNGASSIRTVVFPKSLISIGGGRGFKGYTGIIRLEFPESLKTLGDSSFEGCRSLKEIVFPKTLSSIGKECFRDCVALEKVSLPEFLISLGKYAFSGCSSLCSVFLPKHLAIIEDGVFNNCKSLEKIDIPEGVSSIGEFAFSSTGLRAIELPSSLEAIGDCAFGIVPQVHVSIPGDAPAYTTRAFLNMQELPYYTVVGVQPSPSPNPSPNPTPKGEKRTGRLIAFWGIIILSAILNIGLLFDLAIIAIIAAAVYRKKKSLPWGLFSGDLWKYIWKAVFYK